MSYVKRELERDLRNNGTMGKKRLQQNMLEEGEDPDLAVSKHKEI